MKKRILSLITVLTMVAVLPTSAQLKFGVQGGFNLSEMSLDKNLFNTSNRAGFFIGPTVKFSLPLTGLGMDLSALYNREETKVEGVTTTTFNTVLKQQSLIVPVNVRYSIGLSDVANIFVFGGPQVGFNIGDKVKEISDLPDQAAEWSLNSSNFSVNAGLGVTFATHFQVTANYNVGVGKTGDITFKNVKESVENHKTRANSWRIGLTYLF